MKRRTFIKKSSLVTFSSLALLRCKVSEMTGRDDIGLQLYTVRDDMANDPIETLKYIASIGYTHVENAGYELGKYYGLDKQPFSTILNDLGLKMYSGHTQTGSNQPDKTHTMSNQWEKVCEDAASIDQQYIVLAYLVEEERQTIDDYKKVAELCNKCGEIAKSFGLTLAYHNHDFEFESIDGIVPYDILLSEVDENLMSFEIDLFWTRKGGVEALDYFAKYPGRFPLWHVKDMDDSPEKNFTEVGNGVIDWSKYFNESKQANLRHFYVEQDQCINYKPLESVKISIDNLNKMEFLNG